MIKTARKQTWVELIKAFALVWIFVNHIAEQLFGAPYIANPGSNWPALADRLSQLRPLQDLGVFTIPINLLRYIGWSGDQGVQLFLIASGFGLTWSLLKKQPDRPIRIGSFFLRRAERVYPLWVGVHVLFLAVWFLTGWGLSLFRPETFLSLLGIRITAPLLYYFSPAWWYIGLLIQLYLVYPLLWEGLRRWGPGKLLLWSSLIAFVIRGVGLFFFSSYLDAWSRGAIFITRLPEFVFGISLAAWMVSQPETTVRKLRGPLVWLGALALYFGGTLLSLSLVGMTIAPFCLGAAAFILLYLMFDWLVPRMPGWLLSPGTWLGEHSYSLFLVHHPVLLLVLPFGSPLTLGTAGRIILAAVLTVFMAVLLEWAVNLVSRTAARLVQRIGRLRTLAVGATLGLGVIALVVGAELLVRRFDPQETLGWGERPSLQPDAEFGWSLIPSQNTRLRWESYDYLVQANSLGFPGPEYLPAKTSDTYRILVTGDAFSSAEGVDTDQAWPRLLEAGLAARLPGKQVEVLDFAITGYGPNQYAAVIEHFAPIYQPDLILVEVFVNDFQDALLSNEEILSSIGFNQTTQDSLAAVIRLENLRRWTQLHIKEPAKELLRGQPRAEGYFLGNFSALERGRPEIETTGKEIVARRLAQIQEAADQVGARLMVVMVPAPVQVCTASQLAYYPRGVDLSDQTRYDVDLPQRMMTEVTGALGLPLIDLREPLGEDGAGCLYQPENMHWIPAGHQVVANYLAETLLNQSLLAGTE